MRFVKTLRPQDKAQVMQFNDRTTTLQEFTADHEGARGRHHAHRGVGPHRAAQRALRGAQGPAASRRRRASCAAAPSCCSRTARTRRRWSATSRCWSSRARPRSRSTRSACARTAWPERNRQQFSQAAHLLTALSRETGGQVLLPQLAVRARHRLRPHRRGAAHAVQPGLRLLERRDATASGAAWSCAPRRARACRSATRSATTRRVPDEGPPPAAFVYILRCRDGSLYTGSARTWTRAS